MDTVVKEARYVLNAAVLWPLQPSFPAIALDAVIAALPYDYPSSRASLRATCRAARAAMDARCERLCVSANYATFAASAPRFTSLQTLDVSSITRPGEGEAVARALQLLTAAPLASVQLYIEEGAPDADVIAVARELGALTALTGAALHAHVSRRGGRALIKAAAALPGLKRLHLDLVVKRPLEPDDSLYILGYHEPPFEHRPSDGWFDATPLVDLDWPLLEEVRLRRAALALLPQLAAAQLPRLQLLAVEDTLHADAAAGGAAVDSLWGAAWFGHITHLVFKLPDGHPVRLSGFAPLPGPAAAAAPAVLALRELSISPIVLSHDEARALAAASLPALRKLALAGVEGAGLEALAVAPWLRSLEDFAAEARPTLSEAAAAALAAAALTSLTRLAIGGKLCLFNAASAAALLANPGIFVSMHNLHLKNLQIGSADGSSDGEPLRALARMRMEHLTRLELQGAQLAAHDFLSVLPRAPWIGQLVEVNIAENDLGGVQTFEALADLPMTSIQRVELSHCGLTPACIAALNDAVWLEGIQMLTLYDRFETRHEMNLVTRVLDVNSDPLSQLRDSGRFSVASSARYHDDDLVVDDEDPGDDGEDLYDNLGEWRW